MANQPLHRRAVLRTAGAFGVGVVGAGALAACGSSSGAAKPAGAEGGAGGVGAAPSSGPVTVPVSSVPVGGGTILIEKLVVVTQPAAGQFKAFGATCTHQGCPVTRVEGGKIICPCHNSHFDITTGAPTANSPAKSPLATKSATVSGDTLTVT
jgi:Rieske Fe-S protein